MARNLETMYDLSDPLGIEEAAEIRPGSTLLIVGPSMAGKDDLAWDVLAQGLDGKEGALPITTDGRAVDAVADLDSRAQQFDGNKVTAIDCRADSGKAESTLDSGAFVYSVGAPDDITAIGIGVTKCFDRLHDAGAESGRLGFTSLSTMVTYSDRQTVFKFCHVLSQRLDSAGFLGVFTMDSGAHDEQTMQVIKQAFDGIIELRERDGVREGRLGGLQPEPTEWQQV